LDASLVVSKKEKSKVVSRAADEVSVRVNKMEGRSRVLRL
jgi:hypothetical protein